MEDVIIDKIGSAASRLVIPGKVTVDGKQCRPSSGDVIVVRALKGLVGDVPASIEKGAKLHLLNLGAGPE